MAFVKSQVNNVARITVVGVGGGGGNAVETMVRNEKITGVEFVVVNTDAQSLLSSKVVNKIQIGDEITRGLGAGADPEVGTKAAEESREKIKEHLVDSDMVFVTYGAGGGTGTGAAPVVAEVAKELGALTVAIVTKPFTFEGTRRMMIAEEGIEELKEKVDTMIVIPNQRLLEVVDRKVSLLDAFKIVDSVLEQGVQGISDIITVPGLINVDFADVKAIMENAGSALMGIGSGMGENRALQAAKSAIASPLLDVSIEGAKGILLNITGGDSMTMTEVDEAATIISQTASADANIIFGATVNPKLGDELRITVIATGFDDTQARLARFSPTRVPLNPSGIVSSGVSSASSSFASNERDEDDEVDNTPVRSPEPQTSTQVTSSNESSSDNDDDDFDVPAFLRNLRK